MAITGRDRPEDGPEAALGHDAFGPALVGIAAVGLAGSRRFLPALAPGDGDGGRLIDRCAAEGLVGLLAAAVDAGFVNLGPGNGAALAERAAEAARRTVAAAAEAVAASAALAAAGIDHRVLDGPAVVPRAFVDPSRRPFATVEVAVPPAALERADALAGPAVRVGIEVLPPGTAAARVRLGDLSDAAVPVAVEGGTPPGLPLDALLVRAAVVATAGGRGRLVALRDVAQIALAGSLAGGVVRARAEAWRCAGLLAAALRQAWETFDLADKTDLSVWAARYSAPPVRRRALRAPAGGAGTLDRLAGPLGRLGHAFGRRDP
jgi:Uncharacterised nucleotidyltransferase